MPQYITRPGGHDATYPGPYTATGVDLRLYVLNAQFAPLLATVDRYVNALAPAGTRYIPLGDRVIACFAAMDNVVSSNLQLGSMREVDIAFFIPVVRFDHFIPRQVVFFAPYLFVDMPAGRGDGPRVARLPQGPRHIGQRAEHLRADVGSQRRGPHSRRGVGGGGARRQVAAHAPGRRHLPRTRGTVQVAGPGLGAGGYLRRADRRLSGADDHAVEPVREPTVAGRRLAQTAVEGALRSGARPERGERADSYSCARSAIRATARRPTCRS